MITLVKYRIYCNTEAAYQYIWLDENDPAPTSCPNDATHSVDPNSVAIVDQVSTNSVVVTETPPFAKPDYRTKRDATANWSTCIASTNEVTDFILSEERYVTGGEMIFKNAKEGDYITAEVYDPNSVIPVEYRAALCENWPSVAKYVNKKWIVPTPTDGYGSFEIDTYPLNAKISAGSSLRVTYHASAETGTRSFAMNYHLTKKLV